MLFSVCMDYYYYYCLFALTVIRGNVIFNASFMAAVIDDFSIKTSKSPLNLCVMESCELHDVSGC